MANLDVVVGATLPLGLLLTRRLTMEKGNVRALVLNAAKAKDTLPEGVEVVQIEPKRTSIQDACSGASRIFDLFEPASPKHLRTAADVASAVLLAAIQNGSRVVIASHTFNYEAENSAMEDDALATAESGFANVVIARLPEVFGPGINSPLMSSVYDEVLSGSTAHWLGSLETKRSMLFVGDAMEAVFLLASVDSAYKRVWNISGPEPMSGREFINYSFQAVGKKGSASVWGRGLMLTARLFDSRAREFLEIPYDYYSPYVLDGSDFYEAFPHFSFTRNEDGVAKGIQEKLSRLTPDSPAAAT